MGVLERILDVEKKALFDELPTGTLGLADVPSAEEERAAGKIIRKDIPRKSLEAWEPAKDRPNPIELLKSQEANRVSELIPVRYERMSASAFTFYRGGALVMASDLSHIPVTGLNVQACGDAHIANFGQFAAPDRRLVFDVNDFDETLPGPWEWDLARLCASIEICGRDREFSSSDCNAAVMGAAEAYRRAMNNFAQQSNLSVWYARMDVQDALDSISDNVPKRVQRNATKTLERAKKKDSARAVTKLTHVVDGKLRIISDPPLIVPIDELLPLDASILRKVLATVVLLYKKSLPQDMRHLLDTYHYIDCARKVVGVGSVGLRSWIIVMSGCDENDPLVLQLKEAQSSVMESFTRKSRSASHGQRVVEGQRLMQAASDSMLGWVTAPGTDGKLHDFYVRQLWDWKSSPDLNTINEIGLERLSRLCGWTLARAHARSGNRFAISGYLGDSNKFDKAMASFANTYADLNEQDYARFMDAYESGALTKEAK